MSSLAGDIGINNTGHTHYTTNTFVGVGRVWHLTNDYSGVLATGRSVFWHSNSERDFGGRVGGYSSGRGRYIYPVDYLGKIRNSGKVCAVFLPYHVVWSDTCGISKFCIATGRICYFDGTGVGLTWY